MAMSVGKGSWKFVFLEVPQAIAESSGHVVCPDLASSVTPRAEPKGEQLCRADGLAAAVTWNVSGASCLAREAVLHL